MSSMTQMYSSCGMGRDVSLAASLGEQRGGEQRKCCNSPAFSQHELSVGSGVGNRIFRPRWCAEIYSKEGG
eukprot:2626722-Rhodomonas_salina.1